MQWKISYPRKYMTKYELLQWNDLVEFAINLLDFALFCFQGIFFKEINSHWGISAIFKFNLHTATPMIFRYTDATCR